MTANIGSVANDQPKRNNAINVTFGDILQIVARTSLRANTAEKEAEATKGGEDNKLLHWRLNLVSLVLLNIFHQKVHGSPVLR